ncbi:MAG: histidine kinase [Nonlabens sp.]
MKHFIEKYGLILLALSCIIVSAAIIESEAAVVGWAISSVGIVIVVLIAEQIRSKRKLDKVEEEKTLTEIAILKSQLNPHFFFNTLNNLYSISITEQDKTPKMLLMLSDLMRYTIYKGKEKQVTLNEEWEYINNYVALHKIRYKTEPSIVLNSQFDEYNFRIPPLMLIVLVENAFKHGVEKLEMNAFVEINLVAHKNEIIFEVKNNFENSNNAIEGIGLSNLKRRLNLEYPNRHTLEITNTNNLFNAKLRLEL